MAGVRIVTSERSSGKLYIEDSQHIYSMTRRLGNVVNLRCFFESCPVRGLYIEGDDYIRVTSVGLFHNHQPNLEEVERHVYRQSLRDDGSLTTLPVEQIIQEQTARYPLGAACFTDPEARNLVRRARAKAPPVPLSLQDLEQLLLLPEWKGWGLQLGTRNQRFFHSSCHVGSVGGLIFLSEGSNVMEEGPCSLFLRHLNVMPRHPQLLKGVIQLARIMEKHDQTFVVPLGYLFMEEYFSLPILNGLREIVRAIHPAMDVTHVVSEGQNALFAAATTVWPLATHTTSLMAAAVNELDDFNSHVGGNALSDGQMKLVRRIIACMALPPNRLEEGLQDLASLRIHQRYIQELQAKWTDRTLPVSQEGTPMMWESAIRHSMWECAREVTMGHPKPTMWQFIESLRSFDRVALNAYQSAQPPQPNRPHLRRDSSTSYLANLLAQLVRPVNPISVSVFLERAEFVLKQPMRHLVAMAQMQVSQVLPANQAPVDPQQPPAGNQPPADPQPPPAGNQPPADPQPPPAANQPPAAIEALNQPPAPNQALDPEQLAANHEPHADPQQAPAVGRRNSCIICQVEEASYLLMPCKHFGVCVECKTKRETLANEEQVPDPEDGYIVSHIDCPVCRTIVAKYVEIYFSN